MPHKDTITFCIFSYNRGTFLENCVRSIQDSIAGAEICIFDDRSSNPETKETLQKLEKVHRVVHSTHKHNSKHGSLYENMQQALQMFARKKLLCFLQDDTQLVRPLLEADVDHFLEYFDRQAAAGFIQPCFLKGYTRERDEKSLVFDSQLKVYQHTRLGQSAGTYYSDISVMSPARLLNVGWHFQNSEPKNNTLAQQKFDKLAYLWAPFVMWLPEVPTYRGRRKTLALKIAEKKRRSGFHPFNMLNESEVKRLLHRNVDQLPVAEDYLKTKTSDLEKPWLYYPLQQQRWLKKLNSLELMLRRPG